MRIRLFQGRHAKASQGAASGLFIRRAIKLVNLNISFLIEQRVLFQVEQLGMDVTWNLE